MKYTTFKEIAEICTDGDTVFHVIDSQHNEEDCLIWQKAIDDFAKYLDERFIVVYKR